MTAWARSIIWLLGRSLRCKNRFPTRANGRRSSARSPQAARVSAANFRLSARSSRPTTGAIRRFESRVAPAAPAGDVRERDVSSTPIDQAERRPSRAATSTRVTLWRGHGHAMDSRMLASLTHSTTVPTRSTLSTFGHPGHGFRSMLKPTSRDRTTAPLRVTRATIGLGDGLLARRARWGEPGKRLFFQSTSSIGCLRSCLSSCCGSKRRATRRPRSYDRAARHLQENRPRRPRIQRSTRLAALPRGFSRRTPRGVWTVLMVGLEHGSPKKVLLRRVGP